ncbi:MAG: hypothetical protein P8J45_13035 [Phycisphaerales bacterium]|nr:hypothetical protein [Phycisphaerales bacterium]
MSLKKPSNGLLVSLLAMATLLGIASESVAMKALDPADGPHVDLKLSLDPDALRMEVTMNIVFLDEIIDFDRESPDVIAPVEGIALLDALQDWADVDLVATVDGIDVQPLIDGLEISDPSDDLLPVFPRTGMRGIRKVRFKVTWPLKTEPQEIVFDWPSYPPDIAIDPDDPPPMQIAAEAAVEGVREAVFFTVDSPTWLWRSGSTSIEERLARIPVPEAATPWPLPVVSVLLLVFGVLFGLVQLASRRNGSSAIAIVVILACAGGAWLFGGIGVVELRLDGRSALELPDDDAAETLFVPLHSNIYRAFDYVSESDIYDALERSVEGDLLDLLYRSIYESLVMEEEQGALSRVIAVRPVELLIESIEPLDDDDAGPRIGFVALYRWQVEGRVTHWGHMHERTNEYLARFDVVGNTEGWRIAAIELLEQERVGQYDDPEGVDGPVTDDDLPDDFEL